jgi:hypothetical protein
VDVRDRATFDLQAAGDWLGSTNRYEQRGRRALLSVVDQAEAMTATAGADPANWLDGIGLFSYGSPLAERRRD